MATYQAATPETSRKALIPDGEYRARCAFAESKIAGSGADMIELKWEILLPDGDGPMVYDNLVFTASAGWKIDQCRAACGFAIIAGETVEVLPEDFIGKECTLRLKSDTYKEKKSNKVAAYVVLASTPGPF